MNEEEVFTVLKKYIVNVLPDVTDEQINIDGRLVDLGANSIDRMEISTSAIEELGINVPMIELGKCSNLRDLVILLTKKSKTNA